MHFSGKRNLQNCHYGTLCFALMGFFVCGKKNHFVALELLNFLSWQKQNRLYCVCPELHFFLRFSSAQRSMCQKPSVFSGFHNGPFMGCNNSLWLTTQMMSRRQRLNTEAPACNRSRKNKQKTHKQKSLSPDVSLRVTVSCCFCGFWAPGWAPLWDL